MTCIIARISRAAGLCVPALLLTAAILPADARATHGASTAPESRKTHSDDPTTLLLRMETVYRTVQTYRSVVVSRERVNGALQPEDVAIFEFKKPFEVFMTWLEGPKKGTQLYFKKDWNDNRVRVRKAGVLGMIPINLDPTSPHLANGTNHTIWDAGLGFFIQTVTDNVRRARAAGIAEINYKGKQTVAGRPAHSIEVSINSGARDGYYCRKLLIDVDAEHGLPIRFRTFDWDMNVMEEFMYRDLAINPPLEELERKI